MAFIMRPFGMRVYEVKAYWLRYEGVRPDWMGALEPMPFWLRFEESRLIPEDVLKQILYKSSNQQVCQVLWPLGIGVCCWTCSQWKHFLLSLKIIGKHSSSVQHYNYWLRGFSVQQAAAMSTNHPPFKVSPPT